VVPSFPAPRLPLHSRLVFLGDSITAGSNGPSFANYALNASGGRYYVPPSGNQGVGGSTTLDFLKRSVTTNGSLTKALSLNPKVLHVMGGTNDIGGLSATAADVQRRLRQIYDAALNASARVVASTITKRIDVHWNAAREAVRVAVNAWILAQPDISTVDLDATPFDPPLHTNEGLHPNRLGASIIGAAIGPVLAAQIDVASVLYVIPSDSGNMHLNADLAGTTGVFVGGGGTGQVATGWTIESNVTGLRITAAKEVVDGFNQQRIDVTGTAATAGVVNLRHDMAYTGAIGDVFDRWAFVDLSNVAGAGVRAFQTSADGVLAWDRGAGVNPAVPFAGVVRNFAVALSAARTSSRSQFFLSVVAGPVQWTLRVRQPTWRRVPAGQ
jgi:lysophospholipase L1-like esterase